MELALNPNLIAEASVPETDLIRRAQQGDPEAFDELCRQHGDRLLRQAIALCGDVSAAEDLVQETLVSAWKSIRRYNGRCKIFTWLCSILAHRHGDALRRRFPTPWSMLLGFRRQAAADYLERLADPGPVPAAALEQSEDSQRVLRGLARLPHKQRVVVYLRFYADESLEGIAQALGCSVGTVKSRLFNGLERLRSVSPLKETDQI